MFSLSNTRMGQSATVTVGNSDFLDNFCSVPKKQTSDLFGFRRRSFSQNQCWRSVMQDWTHWRSFPDGVKLHVISIFMIVDAITFEKLADWCYICREQDRPQKWTLVRHWSWPELWSPTTGRYGQRMVCRKDVIRSNWVNSDWSLASSVVWCIVTKAT